MPIYEYRCQKCNHAFEHLARSMGDDPGVVCPECGGKKIERQLSVFAAPQTGGGQPLPCDSGPAPGDCGGCREPGGACPFNS